MRPAIVSKPVKVPLLHPLRDPLRRVLRAPIGAEAERAVVEVRLEYRLHDELDRHLHHPVLYGGDAERPHLAVRLFDIDPSDRACAVCLRLELPSDAGQEPFHAALAPLDGLEGLSVHAGGLVLLTDALPCTADCLLVHHTPEERVEAELRLGC